MEFFAAQVLAGALGAVFLARCDSATAPVRRWVRAGALAVAANAAVTLAVVVSGLTADLYGSHGVVALGAWFAAHLAGWALPFAVAHRGGVRRIPPQAPRRVSDSLIPGLLAVICAVAAILGIGSWWVREYFGTFTGDQLLFVLAQGVGRSTQEATAQFITFVIVPVLCLVALATCLGLVRSGLVVGGRHLSGQFLRRVGGGVVASGLVAALVYCTATMPVIEAVRSQITSSSYIARNYHDPSTTPLTFPATKRNLVHIYLESIENSFYGRGQGGYGDDNLLPDLEAVMKQGISFSHTTTWGGPHQTYGSGHSVAAMINMNAGVPMKSHPDGGTAKAMDYPDFPTLGDILHDHGYTTEIMLGGDASWGGMGAYFRRHGDFDIFDHPEALRRGYLPPGYQEWWGYEDDKLYAFAKLELTRLAAENKPFYFILENADTHFPGGYVSANMTQRPFAEQYANVIFYSQRQVADFVTWMKTQPWWNNTTVLITGDHRSMDKDFFRDWDPAYERTVVNSYLNSALPDPGQARTHRRDFAPFDFFPTTLAALGVTIPGDRLALGTNLFSSTPTLVERDGLERVNDELSLRSDFYDRYQLNMANRP